MLLFSPATIDPVTASMPWTSKYRRPARSNRPAPMQVMLPYHAYSNAPATNWLSSTGRLVDLSQPTGKHQVIGDIGTNFRMYKDYRFVLLAAVAVVIALPFIGTSEEEVILQQLDELRIKTEIREPESALQQLAKARQIGEYFSESTTFDLTSAGYRIIEINSRQQLVQRIAKGRAALASLELALHEPRVIIDGDRAQVEVQGDALGSLQGEQGQFFDSHRVSIRLEKRNNTWLVVGGRHIRNERAASTGP